MRGNLEQRLISISQNILQDYQKANDHIQAWDPYHFARLAGSVGFEVNRFVPAEGVPMPPRVGPLKWPTLLYPKWRLKNFCYTMVFKLTKAKRVQIKAHD